MATAPFHYEDSLRRSRESHDKDMMPMRLSYLEGWNPVPGNIASLYWINPYALLSLTSNATLNIQGYKYNKTLNMHSYIKDFIWVSIYGVYEYDTHNSYRNLCIT